MLFAANKIDYAFQQKIVYALDKKFYLLVFLIKMNVKITTYNSKDFIM